MNVPADWAMASSVSVWEVVLVAVQTLLDWVSICTGWLMPLEMVHCLAALANIWRGCERALVTVNCLDASDATLRSCWADLTNVPTDWVSVFIERVWEESLVTVNCREAWDKTDMGCDVLLAMVHFLETSANTLSAC